MLAARELGQRVSAAWPVDPEILRRPYHFLLEIEHYSGFWRFSDADLDIEDRAGRVFSYLGELDDPSFTQELQVFEVSEGSGSFEAAISFPEDMKALADRGFPLAGARALVWLWWEGTQLEDSVLLLDGRISDPRVGEEGEPVSFSVEAVPLEDDAPFLEPEAKVDSSTWPNHATGARGLFYPWVFGWPYRYSRVDGSSGVTSGSPALYVDTSAGTLLISDSETEVGAKYDGAGASQVRLYNVSTGDSFDGEAQHATDGRGRVVTVVDCSGAPAGFLDVEASYVCRWDSGGGVLGASSLKTTEGDGRGPLALAGDVVAHLLRRSPQVFDPDALAAAARFLNAIEVAGYFDDGEAGAVELAVDHFLDPFLVSSYSGPRGIVLVPLNLDVRPEDAVAHLEIGVDCELVGEERWEGGDRVVNRPRLSYGPRARTGKMQASVELVGDDGFGGDGAALAPGQVFSAFAWESQRRFGRRERALESVVLYEAASALALVNQQVRAFGTGQRLVEVEVQPEWIWLPLGSTPNIPTLSAQQPVVVRVVVQTNSVRLAVECS